MSAPGEPRPRFGQLTYTSFDPGFGRAGGWQVKDARDLEPGEVAALSERVATQLDTGRELPPFPTPEEVAALPRRLAHAPVLGAMASWHTAPAGIDASGRSGNVFSQVVLDRDPGAADPVRPIDRWRSSGWLTPFNHDQVLAAVLPAGAAVPPPGSRIGAEPVVEFLLDPDAPQRPALLAVLCDAVAAATRDGRMVVLGCRDVDTAALWIGAVSHLMSARHARYLAFSTFERASTLGFAGSSGLHLVCVPLDDLGSIPPTDGHVLLDELETVGLGEPSSAPHTTDRGATIVASAFSVLVLEALRDPATARQVLAGIEELDPLADDDLPRAWPIAMAMLREGDAFEEVRSHAEAVVATAPLPDGAPDDVVAIVHGALDRLLGTTTADAWSTLAALEADVVNSAVTSAPAAQDVARIYLRRALEDLAWLAQPGVPPLPSVLPLLSPGAAWLDRVLGALESQPRDDPGRAARVQLRAVDLMVRIGALPTAEPMPRARALLSGTGGAAALILDRDEAPSLEADLERLSGATIDAYVRPAVVVALDSRTGFALDPLGARVPLAVVRRLQGDSVPLLRDAAAVASWAAEADVLDREVMVLDAERFTAVGRPDPHPALTWAARCADAIALGAGDVGPDDLPPDADVLLGMMRAFGSDRVPAHLLVRTLAGLPDSPALEDLCRNCPRPQVPPQVAALADLRDAALPRRWSDLVMRGVEPSDTLLRAADRALRGLPPGTVLDPGVVAMLQAAWLAATLAGHRGGLRGAVPDWVLGYPLDGAPAELARDALGEALTALPATLRSAVHALVARVDWAPGQTPGPGPRTVRATIGGTTAPLLDLSLAHVLAGAGGLDAARLATWFADGDDTARAQAEQALAQLAPPRSGRLGSAFDRLRRR